MCMVGGWFFVLVIGCGWVFVKWLWFFMFKVLVFLFLVVMMLVWCGVWFRCLVCLMCVVIFCLRISMLWCVYCRLVVLLW